MNTSIGHREVVAEIFPSRERFVMQGALPPQVSDLRYVEQVADLFKLSYATSWNQKVGL